VLKISSHKNSLKNSINKKPAASPMPTAGEPATVIQVQILFNGNAINKFKTSAFLSAPIPSLPHLAWYINKLFEIYNFSTTLKQNLCNPFLSVPIHARPIRACS
jgi:hypothetical protein